MLSLNDDTEPPPTFNPINEDGQKDDQVDLKDKRDVEADKGNINKKKQWGPVRPCG